MNAMFPGAAIGEELRKIGEHLDEQPAATVGANGSRQSLTEKRGVFELRLAQYLGLFNLACRINKDWRSSVFRGEAPPSDELAAAMHGVFERWLSLYEHFHQCAVYFERHGPPFGEQLLPLRLYYEEARNLLRDWYPPGLSMAVGPRTKKLSPEAAEKMKALLAERPT